MRIVVVEVFTSLDGVIWPLDWRPRRKRAGKNVETMPAISSSHRMPC